MREENIAKCIFQEASIREREKMKDQPIDNTYGYEEVGCPKCNGYKTECAYYYPYKKKDEEIK